MVEEGPRAQAPGLVSGRHRTVRAAEPRPAATAAVRHDVAAVKDSSSRHAAPPKANHARNRLVSGNLQGVRTMSLQCVALHVSALVAKCLPVMEYPAVAWTARMTLPLGADGGLAATRGPPRPTCQSATALVGLGASRCRRALARPA